METKEYKLLDGRTIRAKYDRLGVCKITQENLETFVKEFNTSYRQAKILETIKKNLLAYDDVSMEFDVLDRQPTVDAIPRENIKLLGEELRKVREGITDEKVLIGYNMAIAICNKYLGESEDKE